MNNSYSTDELFASLRSITEELERDLHKYLDTFEVDEMLSFSNNEETRKKHLSAYKCFAIKINKSVIKFEEAVSILSHLICEADNRCDADLTKNLSQKFDDYSQFFTSIKNFISSSETAFLDKESIFRPALILGYARTLLIAVKNYKGKI